MEMKFYSSQGSLAEALEAAALCQTKDNVMHPHQRRIGHEKVGIAHRALRDLKPSKSWSFHELYGQIKQRVRHLDRIGDLYVYDVAQRIAAKLNLRMEYVYLHAGTRSGASRLGLNSSQDYLCKEDLPPSLQSIPPALLEDFFCMKKTCLQESMLGDWKPPASRRS
jgi:hypothetical protein